MTNKLLYALFLVAVVLGPSFSQSLGAERDEQEQKFGNVVIDTSTEAGRNMAEIATRQESALKGTDTQVRVSTRTRATNSYRAGVYLQGLMETAQIAGGSAGSSIGEAARAMNQSMSGMAASEEKMRSRNFFAKLLFGPDREAVSETEQNLVQAQERLMALEGSVAQIGDGQVREMAEEQLKYLKQEIEGLETQVRREKQSRGILEFLFGS